MGSTLIKLAGQHWDFGTFESDQRGSPIVLVADVTNAALESRYSVLRTPGAAAGYQVTTGKTLVLTRVRFNADTNDNQWLILSGTASVGANSVAAPAGAASLNSRADGVAGALNVDAAFNPREMDLYASCGATLFPHIRSLKASGSLWVLVVGFEI